MPWTHTKESIHLVSEQEVVCVAFPSVRQEGRHQPAWTSDPRPACATSMGRMEGPFLCS